MVSPVTTVPPSPTKALIFIPDISGFTQFVNDTEINHAGHIIQELLNILLEANQIGLEVSEVEGDAILFYRFGQPPPAEDLLEQVKKMFSLFHQHLKKYETHRICNCGACKAANSLTLKFIGHYGEVAVNQVQQFKKLFGIDVITSHRLLKNDIPNHEYFLLTSQLTDSCPTWNEEHWKSWGENRNSSQVYDSGKVDYTYFQLDHLYQDIPPLQEEDFRLPGRTTMILEIASEIEAPMHLVFDVIADVTWRVKWIPGTLPETVDINSYLAQAGQTHRCMANGSASVAHDFHVTEDQIFFTETDTIKSHASIYTVRKLDEHRTSVSAKLYMPRNPVKEIIFSLFIKKKLIKIFDASWKNLNQYCQDLVAQKVPHPYHISYSQSAEAHNS